MDPRLLLNVYPLKKGFECTGTTKEGHRCRQTMVDRKAESDRILETISKKDVVAQGLDERMEDKLLLLAEITLCPRWHRHGYQSQADSVYRKWSRTIGDFITEERARIHEQIQRPIPPPEPAREAYARPGPNEGQIPRPEAAREVPVIPVANDRRPRRPQDAVSLSS